MSVLDVTAAATVPIVNAWSDTEWHTPPWLVELVREVAFDGEIWLDPCTTNANPCRARTVITAGDNGLALDWSEYARHGLTYVNPPYSREDSPPWAIKIAAEAAAGLEIIALLPVRTDTGWWHHCAPAADSVCFLKGRPRFLRPDGTEAQTGKVPIAALYYGDRAKAFERVFGPHGWIP